jgi:hypothetical protein
METIYLSDFQKVYFDRSKRIINLQYNGFPDNKSGFEGLRKVMEFSSSNPVRGAINDCLKMKGTFSMVNDFVAKEYMPRLVQNGLKAYAIVLSDDVFTKFSAEQLIQKLGENANMRFFNNKQEAQKWVESSIR